MLSHCPRSSNRYSCKNFALNDLHSSRARGIAIVEAVQMEQPVDYVQAQLPLESVSESSGVASSALHADENLAVLEGDYVRWSRFIHELSMQRRDLPI